MRRSFALVFLFVVGCGTATNPDMVAARELVRSLYSSVDPVLVVDGPEYAAIPKIPKKGAGKSPADRPAACGVRVKFVWQDGGRTTHDDWVVWVTSDHKAIDWSGNADGDNWRQYVRSFAKR
jgi:hypothetical protein